MSSDSNRVVIARAKAQLARVQMKGTLNDIRHRLSPKSLASDAWHRLKPGKDGGGGGALGLVRPALAATSPATRISLALAVAGWVGRRLSERRNRAPSPRVIEKDFATPLGAVAQRTGRAAMSFKEKAESARDYTSEKVHSARDAAREKAGAARDYAAGRYAEARERASEFYESARETSHEAGVYAREKAAAARQRVSRDVEENPLVVLLGGLAAGALIGALLPRSQRESKLVGGLGAGLAGKARDAARAAREAGRDALSEAGLTSEAARKAARDVADRARKAASAAGDKVKRGRGSNA